MSARKSQSSSAADSGHEVIDRAAGSLHQTVDKLSDGAKQVEDKVRDKARRAEAQVSAAVDDVRAQSEQLMSEATRFVKDNPLLSVGLAVVGGALLHKIFGRR